MDKNVHVGATLMLFRMELATKYQAPYTTCIDMDMGKVSLISIKGWTTSFWTLS